jgi:hypothetical protein
VDVGSVTVDLGALLSGTLELPEVAVVDWAGTVPSPGAVNDRGKIGVHMRWCHATKFRWGAEEQLVNSGEDISVRTAERDAGSRR